MFHCIYFDDTLDAELYRQAGVDYVMMSTSFLGTHLKKKYTLEEIEYVTKTLHLDVIVVMNRFFFEEDLEELKATLIQLEKMGVFRIMFSDFGVLDLIQTLGLSFYTICQTDTTMTSLRDIQQMFEYGVNECVIARELTLDESIYIVNHCDQMLGLHFFGYPLMSTSRKQHLKNYFTQINQTVDLSSEFWIQERNRKERYLSVEDEHGNAVYYGTVVSPYRDIDRLRRANVVFYYDTMGLLTKDVLYFLSLIIQGMDIDLIAEEMSRLGIDISRGLLDQASVLRKDNG